MSGPKRRISGLDGLRGLALAAVVAYHVAPSAFPGGFLGVDVFFVLSGYLLAAILLKELQKNGRINRRSFAFRRLKRVGPALLVLLVALVMLGPALAPEDAHRLKGDVLFSVTGLTNWHLISDGNSYFSQVGRPPMVRHLWSIAIEVQFYLVCPFIVGWLAGKSRRRALALLGLGIGVSAALMAVLFESPDPSRAYYGTEARIGALLSGVMLAFALIHERKKTRTRRLPSKWPDRLGVAAVVTLVALFVAGNERGRTMYPLGFVAAQAAAMMIIYASLKRQRVGEMLEQAPLRWLGRRSYGIYLWHWPAVVLLRPGIDVALPAFVSGALSIFIAVVLGTLSYRFVEGQVRRPSWQSASSGRPSLRSTLGPLVRPVLRPAALLVLFMALVGLSAGLPTGDPIAASLREGQDIIARQQRPAGPRAVKDASPVVEPAPKGPVLVVTPVSQPPVPLPGPAAPRSDLKVTAIGDSVMVSAAGALQERLGPVSYIDATLGRRSVDYVQLARRLRSEGRLGDAVVVQLGNNGPVRGSRIDEMMAELSSVPNVIFVNVRVAKPWQDLVNQVLADAKLRYPNVRVVDWFSVSGSRPQWFASDGTHLKPSGAKAFADLVAGALPPPPPPPAAPPILVLEPVPPLPAMPAVVELISRSPLPALERRADAVSSQRFAATAFSGVPAAPTIGLGSPARTGLFDKAAKEISQRFFSSPMSGHPGPDT